MKQKQGPLSLRKKISYVLTSVVVLMATCSSPNHVWHCPIVVAVAAAFSTVTITTRRNTIIDTRKTYPDTTRTTITESVAVFAKKKGKGKKQAASTSRGFGDPPPTFDDVLSQFRTRRPDDAMNEPCPCGGLNVPSDDAAGVKYKDCCGPLHSGEKQCLTMTDVLKSRFSAFAWRDVGYIIATTNAACRDYREDKVAWAKDLNKDGMFDSFNFVKLDAGPEEMGVKNENGTEEPNEDEGYIEFQVTLESKYIGQDDVVADGGGTEKQPSSTPASQTVVNERSRFLRDPTTGVWSYAGGDVRSKVAGLEDTSLNS